MVYIPVSSNTGSDVLLNTGKYFFLDFGKGIDFANYAFMVNINIITMQKKYFSMIFL